MPKVERRAFAARRNQRMQTPRFAQCHGPQSHHDSRQADDEKRQAPRGHGADKRQMEHRHMRHGLDHESADE
jgi:hypothetical protein